MAYPNELRYTESHEWAKVAEDGATVLVGITDFAVHQLQDLVFIDLPKPGTRVERGKRFGEIESVKAVSDLVAPVTGEVLASNDALQKNLDPLAKDAYGAGWLLKVRPESSPVSAVEGLLDAAAYEKVTAEGGGH